MIRLLPVLALFLLLQGCGAVARPSRGLARLPPRPSAAAGLRYSLTVA